MKILAADYIANYQLKWATERKIPVAGYYPKRVEDNPFGNALHYQTREEYQKGKKGMNSKENERT